MSGLQRWAPGLSPSGTLRGKNKINAGTSVGKISARPELSVAAGELRKSRGVRWGINSICYGVLEKLTFELGLKRD